MSNLELILKQNERVVQHELADDIVEMQILTASMVIDGLLTELVYKTHSASICNLYLGGKLVGRVEYTGSAMKLYRVCKWIEPSPSHHDYEICVNFTTVTKEVGLL